VISTVLLYPEAAKGLEKLEDSIRSRMTESLRDLRKDLEKHGKMLKSSDFWSP
jgi:hypothetical protein